MRLPELQRLIFYHARAHAAAVETADTTRRRIESLVAERAVLERAEPTRRNERRLARADAPQRDVGSGYGTARRRAGLSRRRQDRHR